MKLSLIVLALATFAVGTDAYVVAGILPPVASSFSVSIPAVGQFVTVYSLAYALLSPAMAAATGNWPRRRVLLLGLAVFVMGNIMTAAMPTFYLALLSRALAGVGGALVTPTASAMAAALVPPERRGFALASVLAGLTAATALGAPIGTAIGSLGDWRLSVWFVVGLGIVAAASVVAIVPNVRAMPAPRLRDRIAPLGNSNVTMTLSASFVCCFGAFLLYNYASVVFDRATGNNGTHLAALLLIWGGAATVGSLAGGHCADRFGSRAVVNVAVAAMTIDFALMPWSGKSFSTAAVAFAIWGMCGWSFVVAQQHRLVGIAPARSPILLGLNASALHLGMSAAGAGGALALLWLPAHKLPLLSAVLVAIAGFGAEVASRRKTSSNLGEPQSVRDRDLASAS